jgi:hypothetical protein
MLTDGGKPPKSKIESTRPEGEFDATKLRQRLTFEDPDPRHVHALDQLVALAKSRLIAADQAETHRSVPLRSHRDATR